MSENTETAILAAGCFWASKSCCAPPRWSHLNQSVQVRGGDRHALPQLVGLGVAAPIAAGRRQNPSVRRIGLATAGDALVDRACAVQGIGWRPSD
jgi:hypothetical protein